MGHPTKRSLHDPTTRQWYECVLLPGDVINGDAMRTSSEAQQFLKKIDEAGSLLRQFATVAGCSFLPTWHAATR